MNEETRYLVGLVGVIVYVLVVALRFNKLQKQIEKLEKHAHRHAVIKGHTVSVPPDACDHGYMNWDDCPVFSH